MLPLGGVFVLAPSLRPSLGGGVLLRMFSSIQSHCPVNLFKFNKDIMLRNPTYVRTRIHHTNYQITNNNKLHSLK